MDFSEMGNRIRKHRQLKSMTQDALAEKVGVSPAYIGMIERGERAPSLDGFNSYKGGCLSPQYCLK